MLNLKESMRLVLECCPDLRPRYEAFLADLGSHVNPCGDMSEWMRYVANIFEREVNAAVRAQRLRPIFELAERLMRESEPAVRDGVATCFLESLQNWAAHGSFDPREFSSFLGEESRDFCRGMDEFFGVQTPGLWDGVDPDKAPAPPPPPQPAAPAKAPGPGKRPRPRKKTPKAANRRPQPGKSGRSRGKGGKRRR